MSKFIALARCAGLRPETRGRDYYFIGRGRRWRVNDQGMFQMGDKDFDRWANSVAEQMPAPLNRREMVAAVRAMLAKESQP